jgi:hypothetical protein
MKSKVLGLFDCFSASIVQEFLVCVPKLPEERWRGRKYMVWVVSDLNVLPLLPEHNAPCSHSGRHVILHATIKLRRIEFSP